jgi:phytol kinase
MAGVLLLLAVMMALLKLLQRFTSPPTELTRKLLHMGMGAVTLSFPWLFHQSWPVLVVGVVAAALMLALRRRGPLRDALGSTIAVERNSYGEVYYPLTIALLFAISGGDKLLFTIPVLILALADALAALIGMTYGRFRYTTTEGLKSVEGSVAFFTVAFLSVHVPLLLFSEVGRAECLMIALMLGLLVMLAEAISWRGLDNIFIPLFSYALLWSYLDMSAEALGWRLGTTLGLVVFVLAWRKRSSLDDSSLFGSALFGYAALMIGGWVWLISPLTLFIAHGLLWPRLSPNHVHRIYAVLSITSGGLVCLFLFAMTDDAAWYHAYNTSFAAHLAIVAISYLHWRQRLIGTRLLHLSLLQGTWATLVSLAPALVAWPLLHNQIAVETLVIQLMVGWIAACSSAAAFGRLIRYMYTPTPRPIMIHSVGAVLGLLAAALAMAPAVGTRLLVWSAGAHGK